MGFLFGVILTVIACLAATGMWGSELQIFGIVCLGIASLNADVKSLQDKDGR
jgi:heme/copper-type cytochrome/quinol oxidase subunit 4